MSGIAADYATMTAALDTFIGQVEAELAVSEASLAGSFNNAQRDLLAKAKHRAEEARKLCDDITHRSLVDQSL